MNSLFYYLSFVLLITLHFQYSQQYTCNGVILNQTNLTFTLSTSDVQVGNLTIPPSTNLDPLGSSSFQVTSKGQDSITYTWGYSSEDCVTAVSVTYYHFQAGENSCHVTNGRCGSGHTVQVLTEQCEGVWPTGHPTFYLSYE